MTTKAKEAGHLKGVVTHLIPDGVMCIQYDDDTMLLFDPDMRSLVAIKIIRICLEAMYVWDENNFF